MLKLAVAAVSGVAALGVIFSVANAREDYNEGRKACVNAPIVDTHIIDDKTVVVVDRDGHAARLTLTGPCLQDRNAAVEIKYNANANRICRAEDADITSGRGVPLTCAIKRVQFLSDAEARDFAHQR